MIHIFSIFVETIKNWNFLPKISFLSYSGNTKIKAMASYGVIHTFTPEKNRVWVSGSGFKPKPKTKTLETQICRVSKLFFPWKCSLIGFETRTWYPHPIFFRCECMASYDITWRHMTSRSVIWRFCFFHVFFLCE